MKRKPTRRDLLIVIDRLQQLIGHTLLMNHDRNPHRHADVNGTLNAALELCFEVCSQDPPMRHATGPWSDDKPPKRYI